MKTIFSLQTGIATLLCTAALAGLMACDADTVEQQGGKLLSSTYKCNFLGADNKQ